MTLSRNILAAAVLAVAGLLMLARPAGAVFIDFESSNTDTMGNEVIDFSSSPGELDFDAFWDNLDPIWLEIVLEDGDTTVPGIEGLLAFSSGNTNRGPRPWTDFHIILEGGPTFAEVNLIEPTSGGDVRVEQMETMVWLFFDRPQPHGVEIGQISDPIDGVEINPGLDWFIDVGDLGPGDRFSIHIYPTVVPEPASLAIFGLGLAGLGAVRRRRRL